MISRSHAFDSQPNLGFGGRIQITEDRIAVFRQGEATPLVEACVSTAGSTRTRSRFVDIVSAPEANRAHQLAAVILHAPNPEESLLEQMIDEDEIFPPPGEAAWPQFEPQDFGVFMVNTDGEISVTRGVWGFLRDE